MPVLSRWAYEALDQLGLGPQPTRLFSGNLLRHLADNGMVEIVDLPARTGKGKEIVIRHARITKAGRDAFDQREGV